MTEILTESFCERCGTRYTFESTAPRKSRLGRVRVLGKGMKNFVLSDDASFSEAMADARSEEEIAATAHQLDAFHQTFNFCLTCRQYTCGDCWNVAEGRCLTCAPIPGMEEPIAAALPLVAADTMVVETANGHAAPEEAWPDADLSSARLARALGMDDAEAEATATAEAEDTLETASPLMGIAPGQSLEDAIAEYEARLEDDELGADAASAPADEGVEAFDESLPLAAAGVGEPVLEDAEGVEVTDDGAAVDPLEAGLLLAADAVGDARSAEDEEEPAEDARDPLALALAAAALAGRDDDEDAVRVVEPQPDRGLLGDRAAAAKEVAEQVPVVAEPEAAEQGAEPVAAELAAAVGQVAGEPEAAEPVEAQAAVPEAPRDDVVPQPAWPAAAEPATPPEPAPPVPQDPVQSPWLTVAPEETDREPQWPIAPAWPNAAAGREMPTSLAGRPLLPQADPSGLWAASAREVLTGAQQAAPSPSAAPAPTAQPCVSCGLSLSANARFCRRCGTRQG